MVFCASIMEAADHKALLRVSRACSQTDVEKKWEWDEEEEVGREGSHPGTNRQKAWRLSVSPGPRPGPFPEAARPALTGAVALARNLLPTSSPPARRVSKPRPRARAWGRSRRQASAIYPERRRRRTLAGN